MRGSRAKALKRADRSIRNPGRKHGGRNSHELKTVTVEEQRARKTFNLERMFKRAFAPKEEES